MSNVRVFSLARDLKLSSQEVIDRLRKLGVEVKTASSSVDEDTADKLRRALKIDALTAKRKRVYGSDEDESERDRLEREQQERIAAERAARERAAEEARLAAEARKAGKAPQAGAGEGAADGTAAALAHAPGAPRLAPKSATARARADRGRRGRWRAAEYDEGVAVAEAPKAAEEAEPAHEEVAAAPVRELRGPIARSHRRRRSRQRSGAGASRGTGARRRAGRTRRRSRRGRSRRVGSAAPAVAAPAPRPARRARR